MAEKKPRLGEAELEIMQIIWQADKPLTSQDIANCLSARRQWALSTLMTSLSRLEKKGFVKCNRDMRKNLYTAIISEENYRTQEGKYFIEKLFGNSVKEFVTNLHESKSITDDEISELQEFLETLKGREQ